MFLLIESASDVTPLDSNVNKNVITEKQQQPVLLDPVDFIKTLLMRSE